ncbi:MAG: hypothetical protein WC834_00110 [Eubacteriales bacterium]
MDDNLAQILAKLGEGQYNPQYIQPEQQVQNIVNSQRQQRVRPYNQAIQSVGQGYAQMAPNKQTELNARANQIRAAYIAEGGNPMDLPKEHWGSDPSKGFQIDEGQFHTPMPNMNQNLSYGQKEKLAAITDMYENKPTLKGQLIQSQIAKNNTGGSDMAEWLAKLGITQGISNQETNIKSKQTASKAAVDYINGLSEEKDKFGEITKDGLNKNDQRMLNTEINDMINDPNFSGQTITDMTPGIMKEHPKLGPVIINALRVAESQLINLGK